MYVMKKSLAFIGSLLLLATMASFFMFHTIAGERGILAQPELERKILIAEEQLALLEKHQSHLHQRISLMQNDAIDADMLAETARAELGLYTPNDVIVSIDMSELKF
ncbi:FtsB family cell division protein [Candidatus Puniceispirillum marinum]|uniref:Septum formation initiator n=1 Tax=Puniceispirillum marinum (strain IMCC1322) TaxID=488538 RepID=D5BPG5_PUNMI|nr:septum formation initiator family protein [Candidatus Puniceispirillum marinum]ADE38447.1 hypothetical protein SAR116_0204 [Candidatus Puniceispirillum marinum IMCC1322]